MFAITSISESWCWLRQTLSVADALSKWRTSLKFARPSSLWMDGYEKMFLKHAGITKSVWIIDTGFEQGNVWWKHLLWKGWQLITIVRVAEENRLNHHVDACTGR